MITTARLLHKSPTPRTSLPSQFLSPGVPWLRPQMPPPSRYLVYLGHDLMAKVPRVLEVNLDME
jgi:hypothetical protein